MDPGTTCETDLDSNKYSLASPDRGAYIFKYNTLDSMKKAFRKRKKIVEKISNKIYDNIKKDVEDDPGHNWLPNQVLAPKTSFDYITPKRNFVPLNRPRRTHLG
jgi:hypothetical protein